MMSREISAIEREYHVFITEDYPLMKYTRQLDDLAYQNAKEQERIEQMRHQKR